MKLYIIMPVINCFDLTMQALNSLETEYSTKILLIDNGSTDETRTFAGKDKFENQKQTFAFEHVRNEEAKSVSESWNQGIRIALSDPDCKYIAILNNDILLHPKTIDHLVAFMDQTKYMVVTADNVQDRMSPEVMLQMSLPNKFTDFDCNEISDWRAEGPDFSCFLLTPETIETIGWFDENFKGAYCEDWDFHARINRAWRWGKQYGEPDEKRMHAKRLSTAPYFHFSSQTLKYNPQIRNDRAKQHGANRNYYTEKWGGDHPFVMDAGDGSFMTPFGDARLNWKDCQKI